MIPTKLTEKQKGIILMLMSAFFFSCMQLFVKLSGGGIPAIEQVFFRNVINALVVFFIIKKNKGSLFGPRKYQHLLFGRSFLGFIGVIMMFIATSNAKQADVSILSKMSPFLITIFAAIFLHEKISKIQWPALFLAFGGAYLVATPSFESNIWPLALAFAASVTSAISYTLLSYFKGKVDGVTVIMHFSTFSAVAAIPFMLANFVMPSAYELLCLLCIGICATLGQLCITYAYRMAPASEVSIYNYSGIIFSMLLGYVVLHENIAMTSLIGGALVIGSSLMVYIYNNRKKKA